MATTPPMDAGLPADALTRSVAKPSRRGWQIGWGWLLIAAGVLAVLMPGIAALATTLTLGWLLIFGGGFELAYAIQTGRQEGFVWKLASGILILMLGVGIMLLPVAGAISLALLIGALLFAAGLARTALAFQVRPQRGWSWVLVDGLLSIALSVVIALGSLETSVALIGLLTGFSLIMNGMWRLMLRAESSDESPGPGQPLSNSANRPATK